MQKTDLSELKRTLKSKDKLTISRICTCYVNTEKAIHTKYSSFLNLEDPDRYKYENILKKFMSCKAGDTMQTLLLKNEECKKALDAMRISELKQEELADAFLKKIVDSYDDQNNYAVFLFYSAYDIPVKGKDKQKQDESDEVYQAIYGVICPMEETQPGLSYYHSDQEFHHRDLDQLVGDPVVGFMYPDFDNREVNDQNYVYGICKPKYPHQELQQELFGTGCIVTAKDQAENLNEALAEVFSGNNAEKVTKISACIMGKIKEFQIPEPEDDDNENNFTGSENEELKPKKKVPKPAPEINIETIKKATLEGGAAEEEAESVVSIIKERSGSESTLRVDKISKKSKIKVEDIDIAVPSEKINRVLTEKRNGKKYVLIELENDKSELNINGIICN